MFGNELRKNAYEIIKDSYQNHKIDPEELLKFLENPQHNSWDEKEYDNYPYKSIEYDNIIP